MVGLRGYICETKTHPNQMQQQQQPIEQRLTTLEQRLELISNTVNEHTESIDQNRQAFSQLENEFGQHRELYNTMTRKLHSLDKKQRRTVYMGVAITLLFLFVIIFVL